MTFSRFVNRSQLGFSTVRSSLFVVGFLCLSSLANAAGGKFANDGLWTLWSTLHFSSLARASSTDQNNSTFKHSSRSRPLKLSLSVLHRLAGPNEVQLHAVTVGPTHPATAKLAAVVHGDRFGIAALGCHGIQRMDDLRLCQRVGCFQDRTLPVYDLPPSTSGSIASSQAGQ